MNTDKPDAVELKPCPFCGGPGYLCQIPSAAGGDRFIWVAKCSVDEGCGVEFLGCSRKVDAVKEWNRRDTAERDELLSEVEAARRLLAQARTIILDSGDGILRGTYPDSGIKYWLETRNNKLHATALNAFAALEGDSK